jgi:ATP-dependent RNA helicase DDX3X
MPVDAENVDHGKEHNNMDGSVTENGAAQAANATDAASRLPNFQEQGWTEPQKYNYDITETSAEKSDWEANAVVYHWDGETGDVGPEYPELELALFGTEEDRKNVIGVDFTL